MKIYKPFLVVLLLFTQVYSLFSQSDTLVSQTQVIEKNQMDQEIGNTVYNLSQVDYAPIFAKGKMSKSEFLKLYQKYPEEAAQKGLEGSVIISFTVQKDGEVSNPTILQGTAPIFEKEALRLTSLLPYYTPGYKNGKPVATNVLFPLDFLAPKVTQQVEEAAIDPIPIAPTAIETSSEVSAVEDAEMLKARIRTQNQYNKVPLYIIDGKMIESNIDLDANKIESIRVIKGAKAKQLFGDTGKNGVVIITTKLLKDS